MKVSPLKKPMTPQVAQVYADTLSNLAFIKRQQWAVTNYVVLLIAAVFALHGRATAEGIWILKGLVVLAGLYGLYLLGKMQLGLHKFRRRMAAINGRYFSKKERSWLDISDTPKPATYDIGFLIGLFAVIAVAMGLAIWAMSSPMDADRPVLELRIGV